MKALPAGAHSRAKTRHLQNRACCPLETEPGMPFLKLTAPQRAETKVLRLQHLPVANGHSPRHHRRRLRADD